MPTLQFKGKSIIWNHHMSVPYHTLEPVLELDYNADKANGNLIVEGDNLVALKALLPQYAGRVKCIYIDPPYNTGNEGWAYNDNVNSPMINEWLGKEVAKDDLTKHDKWLAMMTPRLKLLHDFLKSDGVIYLSIDDNEVHHLRTLMNEIFGEENFVAQFIWQKASGNQNDSNYFAVSHEYVLCYAKNKELFTPYNLPPTAAMLKTYDLTDEFVETRGKHYLRNLNDFSIGDRPGLHYDITCPDGSILIGNDHRWRCDIHKFNWRVKEKRIIFDKTKDGEWNVYYKQYINETKEQIIKSPSGVILSYGKTADTLILKVATTGDGSKEIKKLFGSKDIFQYPKPVELVKYLLKLSTTGNDLILDSFAGSGTTGHAVMQLNQEDEDNRQCILVQMTENSEKEPEKNICKDITRERIALATEEYNYHSGFKYLRVGQALDAETLLSGELPSYEAFANYVYYLATGEHLDNDSSIDSESYFVGSKGTRNLYLIYSDTMDTLQSLALNFEKAEAFRTHAGANKITVYAPACFLDDEYLQEHNIEFVSIPYNLFNKAEEA